MAEENKTEQPAIRVSTYTDGGIGCLLVVIALLLLWNGGKIIDAIIEAIRCN